MLPRIALLATGGLGSDGAAGKGKGYAVALTGEQLVKMVPALKKTAVVAAIEQVANEDSSNISPEIWLRLAARAQHYLNEPDIDGAVITHGTDTMEETAYFLDLTVDSEKPLVLVGAQRPASEADTDGPRNLAGAFQVAGSTDAWGMGVLVAMNEEILAARDVTKTHTTAVQAFAGAAFGRLGTVHHGEVRFHRAPLRRMQLPLPERLGRVEIVTHYAGADGAVLRALLTCGTRPDGIVIAGTGAGNVSEKMYSAIADAIAAGVTVVVSSRIPAGPVKGLNVQPGSSLSLEQAGALLARELSPQKARILLLTALANGCRPGKLRELLAG
jgi:L-asparaginase